MTRCSNCHEPIVNQENRCPLCGSLNSKIDDILAKEAAELEKKTLRGQIKIILQADDKKQALFKQYELAKQSLTKELLFTLFIVFVFIFAMTSTVI